MMRRLRTSAGRVRNKTVRGCLAQGAAPTAEIRCFLLEPTDRAQRLLRRHARADSGACTASGVPYHWSEREIEPGAVTIAADGWSVVDGDWPRDDGRWPRHCACGYAFQADDTWQLVVSRLWRRIETGEEYRLLDAPVGAMWYADWLGPKGPDGHALVVMTPAGPWVVERPAADGVFYRRTGAPPRVTVSHPIFVPGLVPFRGRLRDGLLAAG